MRYVSTLRFLVFGATLVACVEEEPVAEAPLTAQVTGHFYFAPGSDWTGQEELTVKNGGETLCTETRDIGGIGVDVCEDCDVALDVVADDAPADRCAIAPETEPDVWIPGRWVTFRTESRFDGVRFGDLRVSDDQEAWEDWSAATLDGNHLSYAHDIELTIEEPADFEPKSQEPGR